MTTETTSDRGTTPVREESQKVAGTAQDRAGEVAQTAREQAGGVAQTAREQAGDVFAHTQDQARDLLKELRSSVGEQTRAQRERMAEVLGGFEQELQQMVDQGGSSGPATEAVRQLTQRIHTWRQYLEGQGDAARDLRSFARRRPGTFLLLAAAAGVVAGRATRGVREVTASEKGDTPAGADGGTPAGAGGGVTGAGYPPATGTLPATGTVSATGTLPATDAAMTGDLYAAAGTRTGGGGTG